MKKINSVLFLFLVFIAIASSVSAEPGIQRYFRDLSGYGPALREEVTDLGGVSSLGVFPAAVLEEASLLSFSRWDLRSKGLSLEVFEMADSSGAFELFTLYPALAGQPRLRSMDLPVGNHLGSRLGAFWRGNFYVQVLRAGGGRLAGLAFERLVEDFADAVRLENLLPVSVTHMPEENFVEGSLRFYLGAESLGLNERFPEPLLEEIGFADRIEIAFGRYLPGDEALFIVGYPTPDLAEEYFFKLQNRLQGYFSQEGIYMKRAGVLIGIFVGPEERAVEVLTSLKYSPTIKWLYEKDEKADLSEFETFFGMLTKTILGIGTFLVVIIGAGFVAGLARYGFISRFPSLTRRKEMVRLDLD